MIQGYGEIVQLPTQVFRIDRGFSIEQCGKHGDSKIVQVVERAYLANEV